MQSILDNDLYKFTMQAAALERYPDAVAQYRFFDRRPIFMNEMAQAHLQDSIERASTLSLSESEKQWLSEATPFLKPHYIEYLANYQFDPDEITLTFTSEGRPQITIDGPWHRTILWEVPLMAMISDSYFKHVDTEWTTLGQIELIRTKAELLSNPACPFADFGTRRRRDYESQLRIVEELVNLSNMTNSSSFSKLAFVGTSNVHLAHRCGIRSIGTMAHEWIMAHCELAGLRHANRFALEAWAKVYGGNLGIALTDTYGTKAFWEDFSPFLAKLYDGVRHDSGCPFEFIEQTLKCYTNLRIDPATKTIVFSDGLNPELAQQISTACAGKIRCSFGIGTNLTNDYGPSSKALNMVIKLWALNGHPVCKLGDGSGKSTGDPKAVEFAKWTFGID